MSNPDEIALSDDDDAHEHEHATDDVQDDDEDDDGQTVEESNSGWCGISTLVIKGTKKEGNPLLPMICCFN